MKSYRYWYVNWEANEIQESDILAPNMIAAAVAAVRLCILGGCEFGGFVGHVAVVGGAA